MKILEIPKAIRADNNGNIQKPVTTQTGLECDMQDTGAFLIKMLIVFDPGDFNDC